MDEATLERKLYIVRKRAESEIAASDIDDREFFYMPSLSARTIVYKGLLLAPQIDRFYDELSDPDVISALCLVHQRFSTNTFPTWHLAHPYRYIAHNGEINTLRGNVNWMHARQSILAIRCSATTSRSCSRSSRPAAATPPTSTTRSNCCSSPGARCRTSWPC